ncbi:hypothetical protein HAX54_015387 [Datura stramonium]|uniref:Uncharacterized protein n=1 Tax=Datura stramonium TaxID=4076 RepID=A0ABS8TPJ6_DATST|nr:hypothetical protein [Datura stramonium]
MANSPKSTMGSSEIEPAFGSGNNSFRSLGNQRSFSDLVAFDSVYRYRKYAFWSSLSYPESGQHILAAMRGYEGDNIMTI